MEVKKRYTKEELDELVTWFREHMDTLPDALQLDKATYIPDLRHTVQLYFDIVAQLQDNDTYGAQIHHLFAMRDKVLELQANG